MSEKSRNWLEPAKKETPEQALTRLRARIDALDDTIIGQLLERIGIIREVATLKGVHWPKTCHIRSGREGQMHVRIAKRFTGTGFPARTATAIWRLLIGASTHVESPLNIAYLASEPAHFWLGREYFSPEARLTATTKPALSGDDNILLLPLPENSDWWKNSPQHNGEPLHIFARLPLADEKLPDGAHAAVALAAIMPEASGDDISYFVMKGATPPKLTGIKTRTVSKGDMHLLITDGFLTPETIKLGGELKSGETLIWLGSHPRPLEF